jgi:hypothetical protein
LRQRPHGADIFRLHRAAADGESDLTYARLGEVQPAILRNRVAFHAEQAAEKAFKGVLVHAAVEFPRTHDLQSLLLLSEQRNSVPPEIERANALTRFAVEARHVLYTDDSGRICMDNA